MMVITILFSCYHPMNSLIIQVKILDLCNFDFFNTVDLYNSIFKFEEGGSFSQIFEQAGFDGHNFILGIGPMFLAYVAFPIFVLFHQLARGILSKKFTNKFIKGLTSDINYRNIVVKFLFGGAVEIGITALVTVKFSTKTDFYKPQEVFQYSLAVATLIALVFAPAYTFASAKAYRDGILNEESHEKVSSKHKGLFN